jgi:acetyl-CoA carboxylase biotin carboxyl carrier protein
MATITIQTPIPGILYHRPAPEQACYAQTGQKLQPEDTICLIEVMKTYHEIKSGKGGTFVRYLVDNEAVVEAGQDIALIESDEN